MAQSERFRPLAGIMVLIRWGVHRNQKIFKSFRPLAGIMVLIALLGKAVADFKAQDGFRPLAGIMVLISLH